MLCAWIYHKLSRSKHRGKFYLNSQFYHFPSINICIATPFSYTLLSQNKKKREKKLHFIWISRFFYRWQLLRQTFKIKKTNLSIMNNPPYEKARLSVVISIWMSLLVRVVALWISRHFIAFTLKTHFLYPLITLQFPSNLPWKILRYLPFNTRLQKGMEFQSEDLASW